MKKRYPVIKDMTEFYNEYTRTISKMPPSLKTLNLLVNLCRPGDRVLELGSGFSTFCLAFYKDLKDYVHWSVDNSNEWLEKTREYCTKYDCKATFLMYWARFVEAKPDKFDIVFFDIGKTPTRATYLPYILENHITSDSLILLDDMHKGAISGPIYKILDKCYYYREIPVKEQTLDEFGRFCVLITDIRRK